jgi:hypothetical protein
MSELTILSALTFVLGISVIIYNIFRASMQKKSFYKDKHLGFYTRNRILTISFSLFAATLIFLLFAFALFYAIKNRVGFTFQVNDLSYLISVFFLGLLASFAVGCHAAAIITEKYIKSFGTFNHRDKNFKAIYLYNEFFHGPVGHVVGYSSFIAIMLVLAILEKDYPVYFLSQNELIYYLINSVVLAAIFLYLQFKGLIWKHQIPWFGGIFITQLLIIYYLGLNLAQLPFNVFFLVFQIMVNFGLAIKFIFYRRRKSYYPYNLKTLFDQLLKNSA